MRDSRTADDCIDSRISALEGRIDSIASAIFTIKGLLEKNGNCDEKDSKLNVGAKKIRTVEEILELKKDDILKSFDFNTVHDVMKFVGWSWLRTNGVPTVEDLKNEANRLLSDAIAEKTNISTGGLRAVYESLGEDDNDPYLGLEFILEDIEGFAEEDEADDCMD